MSIATLLLDTNIIFNEQRCARLTEHVKAGRLRVCVPTLVHAERIRQVADKFGERFAIDVVRQFIEDARFELIPLTEAHAETLAAVWLELKSAGIDHAYWKAHNFDILLCAIARSTDYRFAVDDTGRHFETVSQRMNWSQVESWLQTLP
jgi:predicted nucleic acid-binding protein